MSVLKSFGKRQVGKRLLLYIYTTTKYFKKIISYHIINFINTFLINLIKAVTGILISQIFKINVFYVCISSHNN